MSVASEKIAQIFIPLVSGVNKNRWNERQSSCITLTTILTALSGEFFALRVRHSSRKSCLSSWSCGGGSGQRDPSRPLASHLNIRMWLGLQDYSYSSVLLLGPYRTLNAEESRSLLWTFIGSARCLAQQESFSSEALSFPYGSVKWQSSIHLP